MTIRPLGFVLPAYNSSRSSTPSEASTVEYEASDRESLYGDVRKDDSFNTSEQSYLEGSLEEKTTTLNHEYSYDRADLESDQYSKYSVNSNLLNYKAPRYNKLSRSTYTDLTHSNNDLLKSTSAVWYKFRPMIGWVRCSCPSSQNNLTETKNEQREREFLTWYEDSSGSAYQRSLPVEKGHFFRTSTSSAHSQSESTITEDKSDIDAIWYKWMPMVGWRRCTYTSIEGLKEFKRTVSGNEVSVKYNAPDGSCFLKEFKK